MSKSNISALSLNFCTKCYILEDDTCKCVYRCFSLSSSISSSHSSISMCIADSGSSSHSCSDDTNFIFEDLVDEEQILIRLNGCDSCCFIWIIAETRNISTLYSFSRFMFWLGTSSNAQWQPWTKEPKNGGFVETSRCATLRTTFVKPRH